MKEVNPALSVTAPFTVTAPAPFTRTAPSRFTESPTASPKAMVPAEVRVAPSRSTSEAKILFLSINPKVVTPANVTFASAETIPFTVVRAPNVTSPPDITIASSPPITDPSAVVPPTIPVNAFVPAPDSTSF